MKEAARFFKALSDESRLKMLWLLLNCRELCVCDVMAVMDITQSKASRHLAALRHIGIATDRREGLWSYYSLRAPKDELAKSHLRLLRTTLAKHPDAKPLLDKLSAWLRDKGRDAGCEPWCMLLKSRLRTGTAGTSIRTSARGKSR
jgi:ArsR family transcriptional regulator